MKHSYLILMVSCLGYWAMAQTDIDQAFLQAVKDNDVVQVKALIVQGANVNFTDEDGWTALHYAASDNNTEIVQLLLTHDIDKNKQTNEGSSPLILAAKDGHLWLCKSLLEQGANPTLKDTQGKMAVNYAQEKGYKLIAAYLKDPTIDISGTTWKMLDDSLVFYYEKGDYSKSLLFAEQAYQRAQKEFNESNASFGTSLNNLAALYSSTGRYTEAEPLYKQALQNAETTLAKDHPDYGSRLDNLAVLYEQMGRYAEAEPLNKEALQNTETTLGKNHPDYGIRLNNLAALYVSIGRYTEAESLYKEALQVMKTTLGKNHPDYSIRLSNLALLYEQMGRYAEAEPLNKEALQNTETTLGKNHPDYGIRLNNLAVMYYSMGRYAEAETLYKEALQNTETTLGKDHPEYGNSLNNLAILYRSMGRYAEAEHLYKEALQNTETTLGKDHPEYGTLLNNLAGLYESMGHHAAAESLYNEALQNTETTLGKDHPEYGRSLNNLGLLYEQMGRYAEAKLLYKEALQVMKTTMGKDHPEYGRSLNNLGLLYKSMGQYAAAEPLFVQANEVIYHNLNQSFIGLSEKEKKQYLQTVENTFKTYHSFVLRRKVANPSTTTLSYNNALINKGLLLQSSVDMRQNIQQSGDSVLLQSYDIWIGIKNQLSRLYALPIKERYVSVDSLEMLANDLEKELNRGASAFSEQSDALQISWEDVKHSLGENEAAIEFISFRYRSDTAWTDSTLYVALVLRPEGEYPHMIELFEEKQLQQLLEKSTSSDEGFISQLYSTRGVGVVNVAQTFKGDSLYQLIWQPLDSFLAGVQTVYFSSSGILHQIAFAALPYQQELLSEHFNLHQLSSTRLLALPSSTNPTTTAVVYGGIDYDTEPATLESSTSYDSTIVAALPPELSRGENRGTSWQFLLGTATEAEKVYNLLTENNIHSAQLQADQAQEETFKALSKTKSPSIIHVASHGFFFSDIEKKQSEEIELLRGEDTYRSAEDPLLRSGLLFTGANHVWQGGSPLPGVEDGILTAYEVAQLNLSNTELVVLSACETGLGEVQGSEGVYGLQRAFKMAGAKNLLMSLWKVPDEQTVELMEKFYTYWLSEQQPISAAFQQAQQEMQAKYNPYFWAAFVLVE